MKKLLPLLFVLAFNHSITKAQCPPGAFAYQSTYAQCPSGCGVLLIGWPAGVLVNIYGGAPLKIITNAVISGTLGSGGTGDAFVCVPCNIPLVFASSSTNATTGCVIAVIGVVPVKLTNISAVSSGEKNCTIKWTTTEETGGAKYVVQRSNDGSYFNDLNTLTATGNSSTSNEYSYEDKTALPGNNYYRLKIIDVSGKSTYSEIFLVKKQKDFGFTIYPNPVQGNFNIAIPEKFLPASVVISNSQGQPVYSGKATQSTFKISKQFQNGIYAVRVTGNNKMSMTQKLIKN